MNPAGTVGSPVQDLASLADTRTWTIGGGNTFPGAEVPYGMVQWSPDTVPNRNAGGGYSYTDTTLYGYSLTHISGPGCGAAGDVPILPVTGSLPSGDPNNVTTPLTHTGEVAQAGYKGLMQGRRVVVPGLHNKIVPLLPRFMPRGMLASQVYARLRNWDDV